MNKVVKAIYIALLSRDYKKEYYNLVSIFRHHKDGLSLVEKCSLKQGTKIHAVYKKAQFDRMMDKIN